MKKKLLFIMPSLDVGGAEKSLITLLGLLDYARYDVELMLFKKTGFFLERVPGQVRIIDAGRDYEYFDGSARKALAHFIGEGKFRLAWLRLRYTRALDLAESVAKRQSVWRCLSDAMRRPGQGYDAVIAYMEGNPIYYALEKTQAVKKIGYIHSDYNQLGLNPEFDRMFFEKLDAIVTVSDACAESMARTFPSCARKITVIENIISVKEIERLAYTQRVFDENFKGLNLVSVARLAREKGIDIALAACALLVDAGVDIRWHIIGDGSERQALEMAAAQAGLSGRFLLLGAKKNPYPYMAQCDIYVQPSRYEGKSIALEEAKALAKPIVATEFSTVGGQLKDGENAFIAGMEPEKLAQKILSLIRQPQLREQLSANLKRSRAGNEAEIEKFYTLLN